MLSSLRIGSNAGIPVKIGESDRYLGICLTGKPGEGKTALMSNWWMTDSLFKTGKILIDPSGFFCTRGVLDERGSLLLAGASRRFEPDAQRRHTP